MSYQFKAVEWGWGALYVVLAFALAELATDFTAVEDWRVYAASVGVGLARVVVAYILTRFVRSG